MLPDVLKHLDATMPQALARLKECLAIPSISAQAAHAPDIARAARWTAEALEAAGLEASVEPTAGHPVVLGRSRDDRVHHPGAPRVLFYGHYDVQPPDPLEQWTSPPFEPVVRDNAVYARGASDDKGQVCCFLDALRAWTEATGKLPGPVTVLIEGEEEIGSVSLRPFLERRRRDLAAAVALISDTQMWDRDTPSIIYGLRGLLYFDVQLHHARRDTHSGTYGGTFANPAAILSQVLGRLFDDRRRVTIPGFYDDVAPLTDAERAQWRGLGFDEAAYLGGVGVAEPFGEAGFDTLERRWVRPSCDINGLYGGYGGPGAKTIIPAFAGAKVSFRLAPNQKAQRVARAFEQWLRGFEVHGCVWKITHLGGCDPALLPVDSPWLSRARGAIEAAAGRAPVLVREGATVPVVADFKDLLGLDSLMVGFGLADDNLHAPNEKFDLGCFALGRRTHARLLADLAG